MDINQQKRKRAKGHVIECTGMTALIATRTMPDAETAKDDWSVGQLLSIKTQSVRVVGVVYAIETVSNDWNEDADNHILLRVELVGEVGDDEDGDPVFSSGLSAYPHIGAIAHQIRQADLVAIFSNEDGNVVSVGALSQNRDIPALISVDNMISRHFAVVGTTGVGKSTAVSLLIRKIIDARPDIRVLILDPHNEFEHALPRHAIVIDEKSLKLPYWLYSLEEVAAAIFNGRPPEDEEIELLRDLIPIAKQMYDKGSTAKSAAGSKGNQLTADTPVPYRMADLIKLIDERRGSLDAKSERGHLRALQHRIQALLNDPRYQFMFGARQVTDSMGAILSRLFRIPDEGCPVAILQLAGIPSEVVNSTVSVLSRLAFDMAVWSNSRIKTLIVCEEAHRYIPADPNAGFQPVRQSISRVAKEGRKYGVHLAVITQRPSELDPTILSQCNTFFAMRLGNEVDQSIVRKAIPGGASSFINFIPSLANREAIAFGQGASTPMRLVFEEVPTEFLPGNEMLHEANTNFRIAERADLNKAIALMRRMSNQTDGDDPFDSDGAPKPKLQEGPIPQREAVAPAPIPQRGDAFAQETQADRTETAPQWQAHTPLAPEPASMQPRPTPGPSTIAPPPLAPERPTRFTPPGPLPDRRPPVPASNPVSRADLMNMVDENRKKPSLFSGFGRRD